MRLSPIEPYGPQLCSSQHKQWVVLIELYYTTIYIYYAAIDVVYITLGVIYATRQSSRIFFMDL
jgi:hypothetical protein